MHPSESGTRKERRDALTIEPSRLSTSIAFYKTLLGIRSVQVVSNSVIQLEYDIKDGRVATLVLQYDEKTKRLENAQVSYYLSFRLGRDLD